MVHNSQSRDAKSFSAKSILKWILSILLSFATLQGQVTFSEIMFDPATNEYHDEFVEIYNLSSTDSVDIRGWQFSDSSSSERIIQTGDSYLIPPLGFAIILDGSYRENSDTYDSLIPEQTLVLTISDNSFGASGLANSKGEYLSIVDSVGDTLTTYRYSTGNVPGHSDEKIILNGSNTFDNWAESQIPGGTPGYRNSITPFDFDVGFTSNSVILPPVVFENEDIQIQLTVFNLGTQMINDSIKLEVYHDLLGDSIISVEDQLISEKTILLKQPGESAEYIFTWKEIPAGSQQLVFNAGLDIDQNPQNNRVFRKISVVSRSTDLHINEIKFLSFEDEPEWLEIYNSGAKKIYLKDWAVSDTRDTAKIDSSCFIYPGQFKILSADTLKGFYNISDSLVLILNHFPVLNNGGDDLFLLQPDGGWREYVGYEENWLEGYESRQVSLERINPGLFSNKADNWGPCLNANGATPGISNSIYSELEKVTGKLTVSPNPFAPDGLPGETVAVISGNLPEKSARMRLRIFDIQGRLIRTLNDNNFTGSRFNLVWDGTDNQGQKARIGIYIILAEFLNDRNGTLLELKSSVVLAGKL